MGLEPKVIEALKEIKFVERYKKLSDDFNKKEIPLEERFEDVDINIIKEILSKFGEKVTYNKSEKFFKVKVSKIKNYTFNNKIAVYIGMVELIWEVKDNKDYLLGNHHLTLVEEVLKKSILIKKPLFETYGELEKILRINFEMFDDFKNVLLSYDE
ncbi:MAG: hypothetical protein KIC92_10100 [Clostridiales bacterium]|nr:hypothetical protein [Clostridiales bacterium]